jgi:hypothetical protein
VDPVSVLAGGALLAAGALIGRVLRLRRNPPPAAVCGCGHHYAMHDPITGRCYAHRRQDTWSKDSHTIMDVQCACRIYTGPQPTQILWHDGVAILPSSPAPATDTPTDNHCRDTTRKDPTP